MIKILNKTEITTHLFIFKNICDHLVIFIYSNLYFLDLDSPKNFTKFFSLVKIQYMETATLHPYIIHDGSILEGEPIIKGTKTPVRAIVENWRLGLSPEEIVIHLPHLTLAQVFDALSYYSDHKDEINDYIEKNKIPDNLIHPSVR